MPRSPVLWTIPSVVLAAGIAIAPAAAAAQDVETASVPAALRLAVLDEGLLSPSEEDAWRSVGIRSGAQAGRQVCELGREAAVRLVLPVLRRLHVRSDVQLPGRLEPDTAGEWSEVLEQMAEDTSDAAEESGAGGLREDWLASAHDAADAASNLAALCGDEEAVIDEVAEAYVDVLVGAIDAGLGRDGLTVAYRTFADLARASRRAPRRQRARDAGRASL